MQLLKTIVACCDWSKKQFSSVGFVPTMGALHNGHLSLVKKSLAMSEQTIVSIYINPTQFAQGEDLSLYPKTLTADLEKLKELNVDAVFLPDNNEMYPKKDKPFNYTNNLFQKLEGKFRPHFFKGVTTIVAKLFNAVNPTYAFFGEKDAQQLLIIKKMIADLNFDIRLVSCPIIRDNHGLALSSRNNYLSREDQKEASFLYKNLLIIKSALDSGEKNIGTLKKNFNDSLKLNSNFKLDYISIAGIKTLTELDSVGDNMLISTAVFFKNVRLIDNFVY